VVVAYISSYNVLHTKVDKQIGSITELIQHLVLSLLKIEVTLDGIINASLSPKMLEGIAACGLLIVCWSLFLSYINRFV
jgi:hypothetical protein